MEEREHSFAYTRYKRTLIVIAASTMVKYLYLCQQSSSCFVKLRRNIKQSKPLTVEHYVLHAAGMKLLKLVSLLYSISIVETVRGSECICCCGSTSYQCKLSAVVRQVNSPYMGHWTTFSIQFKQLIWNRSVRWYKIFPFVSLETCLVSIHSVWMWHTIFHG